MSNCLPSALSSGALPSQVETEGWFSKVMTYEVQSTHILGAVSVISIKHQQALKVLN